MHIMSVSNAPRHIMEEKHVAMRKWETNITHRNWFAVVAVM